jgi:hypothetical protein
VVWVLVFGGIALAGLVMLICYGVWLAHKAADVMSEVGVLADRAEQLFDLLAQIQPPDVELVPLPSHSDLTIEAEVRQAIRDVG